MNGKRLSGVFSFLYIVYYVIFPLVPFGTIFVVDLAECFNIDLFALSFVRVKGQLKKNFVFVKYFCLVL